MSWSDNKLNVETLLSLVSKVKYCSPCIASVPVAVNTLLSAPVAIKSETSIVIASIARLLTLLFESTTSISVSVDVDIPSK